MKRNCKTLILDKLNCLKTIRLLVLLAFLCGGCYPATLAPQEENVRSKQATPPPGKALVYFYLGDSPYAFIDVAVSLNGFKNRISENTYVLWEVFPGEYLLTFESAKLEIQCEADQIYYYCVSSVSMFGEKLGQASSATGRAKINEFPLVKWFKDIPAPGQSMVAKEREVGADVAGAAEAEKAQVMAQVPSDEAIALLEVKIDKVSDEVQTIYNPRERRTTKAPILLFSPDEHIRSSLIQAKFRIVSKDMKETPDATLAVKYHEKNKEPVLGSPKTYFLSYELIHRGRGKIYEGGVGPQGCDTLDQLENHPQFQDIGLLIRDAFIRSDAKATVAETEESIDTTRQPGYPNTDSASTESAQLGEKSESTSSVKSVPLMSTQEAFAIRDPKFKAKNKDECKTDVTIISVDGDSFKVGAGSHLTFLDGTLALWCYGAKHTWKGRLTYAGYVFDSDKENPLQFMVDKDKGYVYLGGEGTVTLPDGTAITLPSKHTDGFASTYETKSGVLPEEKQGDLLSAQRIDDPKTSSHSANKQDTGEKKVEPSHKKSGETDKTQSSAEIIGSLRLIIQKDSDVTVTKYLYSRYNPFQRTGSVTVDKFEYEPDADIKASLAQMGFDVIAEDSNKSEDVTLTVHYEEKRRGGGLDSPTAYYFSFILNHKTKGTLLEGNAKATGCDSPEELRNDPQFRDIGLLVRKAFIRKVAGDKEKQEGKIQAHQQPSVAAKPSESAADKNKMRIPFSKDKVVKIESISAIVGDGEASFSNSEKPGMLSAGVDGTIPVVDGMSCFFCVDKITIGPDTKVPLSPFFTASSEKEKYGGQIPKSITLKNMRLTGPGANDDTTEYLLSGKNGAILKKVGNGFILVEGQAYYVRNVDSKDSVAE